MNKNIDIRALKRRAEELKRKPFVPTKESKALAEKLSQKAKESIEERRRDVRRNIYAISEEGADELISIRKARISILPSLNENFRKNYDLINWRN